MRKLFLYVLSLAIAATAHAAVDNNRLPVITEAPEGTVHLYQKAAKGIFARGSSLTEFDDTDLMGTMVFTNDNEVYIMKPMSYFNSDSYIKGTVEGNTITVPVPQCLLYDSTYGYGFNLVALKTAPAGSDGPYVPDLTVKSIKFEIAADGTITTPRRQIFGVVEDAGNTFAGWADTYQKYTPYGDEYVKKPESLASERWNMTYGDGDSRFVDVAIGENEIYIGGFSSNLPDAWFKGRIEGDKVMFDDKQLLGDWGNRYFISLMFGNVTVNTDFGIPIDEYTGVAGPMVYSYDAAAKTLTPDQDLWMIMSSSIDLNEISGLEKFHKPTFSAVRTDAAVPKDPTILEAFPFNPSDDYGSVIFDLPNVDVDGKPLDTGKYFYNVFIDGVLFTFKPDEYRCLKEAMTDVPYTFDDPTYKDIVVKGTQREVYYFMNGIETFGVQGVYTIDGVTNKTSRVTVDIATKKVTVTPYDPNEKEPGPGDEPGPGHNPGDGSVVVGENPAVTDGMSRVKYTYNDSEYGCWGKEKVESYDVAMRIDDPALIGKKVMSIVASLYAVENISDLSIWMTKELTLKDGKNAPDIISVPVEINKVTGEMKVTFSKPYTITEDGVYIGYSLTVDELTADTRVPLLLSLATNENGFYLHTSRSVLKWTNYVKSVPASAAIEVMVEGEFPESSVSIKAIKASAIKAGTTVSIPVEIMNQGGKAVNDIDYTYGFDGKRVSQHYTFPSPIPSDLVWSSSASLPVTTPSEIGEYTLTITIDKVNGMANEATKKTESAEVSVLSFVPRHRPVMEEYTGTWCGWCPRGWFAMEKMNELYPEDFIGIAYHASSGKNLDPMHITDDFPSEGSGYPSATIDRGESVDPYLGSSNTPFGIELNWKDASDVTAICDVKTYAWWADAEKTVIDTKSYVRYIHDEEDADYSIGYVLIANDLHSTDKGWDQNNYYPREARNYMGTELEVLCHMADPINDLHFNEVAIIAKDAKGVEGSLPSSIEMEKAYEHDHSFIAAEAVNLEGVNLIQDKEKLEVVAMVIDNRTKKIINAYKAHVTPEAAIDNIESDAARTAVEVVYHDLQGRRVAAPTSGVYVKTTRYNDGSIVNDKVMLHD